jgi:hypothetical protein
MDQHCQCAARYLANPRGCDIGKTYDGATAGGVLKKLLMTIRLQTDLLHTK